VEVVMTHLRYFPISFLQGMWNAT